MIIYKITNNINDKIYIGQTTQALEKRWWQHCHDKKGYCRALANAIAKYGPENFTVEQIDVACTRDELDRKEIYWIKFYDSMNHKKGYNLLGGGNHPVFSEETRKKLSLSRKGRKLSQRHKDNIRKANLGKRMSEETKNKLRVLFSGTNGPFYGKHHTEYAKQKISENNRGKIVSSESRKKMSLARSGKRLSNEHKQKIAIALMGKKNHNAKRVLCVETGEIFDCMNSVYKKLKINSHHIGSCCSGKRKTTGGYHWKYADEN